MLRATLWALRARRQALRAVSGDGIATRVSFSKPPRTPVDATRAVTAVMASTRATCLVRSLVLQRWLLDHGEAVDVVIGVTAPSNGFRAHAWLDRPGELGTDGFEELHRLPAIGTST
jgi:hypothetical protein